MAKFVTEMIASVYIVTYVIASADIFYHPILFTLFPPFTLADDMSSHTSYYPILYFLFSPFLYRLMLCLLLIVPLLTAQSFTSLFPPFYRLMLCLLFILFATQPLPFTLFPPFCLLLTLFPLRRFSFFLLLSSDSIFNIYKRLLVWS